jgi:hypothetical protein
MIKTERIDWVKMFKQEPKRWLPVYDNQKHLIEVHDMETGSSWFTIGDNRWMLLK